MLVHNPWMAPRDRVAVRYPAGVNWVWRRLDRIGHPPAPGHRDQGDHQ